MIRRLLYICFLFIFVISCALSDNYQNPDSPLYTGDYRSESPTKKPDTLKLVCFNIKYSRQPEKALDIFKSNPDLQDAHIILLQEMQNKDVDLIARGLNCQYIYYPATSHIVAGHDFGNAILSKFKLSHPEKIILPYLNPVNKSIRIAVSGTVHIGQEKIRLVSLHLETPLMRFSKREDQIQTVLDSIQHQHGSIIIGGDFNTAFHKGRRVVKNIMTRNGYTHASQNLGYTSRLTWLPFVKFQLDHIYSKNIKIYDAGKVNNFKASDHLPLWIVFSL